MLRLAALAALLALTAQHAYAEGSSRDFCANRPGRGNPPCVLDPGRLQVETSFADYTHDRQSGTSTDTTLFGDLALRLGVTTTGEVQLAFSPDIKTTVKGFGAASSETGYGDLTLAWRQSLRNPDGSGASIALQPFVTAPTGKGGFSAGGWQGGVAAPMAFALPDGFNLALTPQLAAVRNTSGPGAHMSATGVVGLSHPLGPFSLGAEFYINYDADPSGHATTQTIDLLGAWLPRGLKDTQLDLGLNAGVDRNAPDYEVYAGIAHRF